MKPFKLIAAVILAIFILAYFFYPDPKIEPVEPTQLPWNISIDEQKNSTVFGLKINHSNLQDAFNEFGEGDKMALYADVKNPSIEVYFGYVKKAGLAARVIIKLNLTTAEADTFLGNANSRMQSNSEIPKIDINARDRHKALNMKISSITYMPKYSGLDDDYLFDRFGTPSHQIKLSETANQYFYKTLGLSVISDSDGKEVFQYTNPADLRISEQAIVYEP